MATPAQCTGNLSDLTRAFADSQETITSPPTRGIIFRHHSSRIRAGAIPLKIFVRFSSHLLRKAVPVDHRIFDDVRYRSSVKPLAVRFP